VSQAFSDIAFTPAVRAMQTRMGSRKNYAQLDESEDRRDRLGGMEADFIGERDSFYQATVSETGWPYVQFRGGPAGFLKVLDEKTIGYADFRGNVQYISVGNFANNDRVSIILMDYANRRRLKILGRVRIIGVYEDPELISRLESSSYRARVERGVIITVEGYDWNCPQHITPRFTEEEISIANAPLREELAALKAGLALSNEARPAAPPAGLGNGPLALVITGVRQLTPRVRAYELRAPDNGNLPTVEPGAHIDVPVRPLNDAGIANDIHGTRRYSINRASETSDSYEIAVQKDDNGRGGSLAVHRDYQLGMTLHCGMPGNDFPLHAGKQPAVLIAGGIGITPIHSMAMALARQGRRFALHYAARSRQEAAFLQSLQSAIGDVTTFYFTDAGQKLDVASVMDSAPANSIFYVCGPNSLIESVRKAAGEMRIAEDRIRFERFSAPGVLASDQPLRVTLQRSGKLIDVSASQSILYAVQAAGVDAPAACRTGNCGTCAVKVLDGEPDHRDLALSVAERNQAGLMCICVSRANSLTLTLDL
jgi:ferredoxin-NADP reductase/predicted pyridoxine 5'-phosphate oxidase superfamily flavin-nucleotide-binding protein